MGGLAPWGDPSDLYCELHNLTYAHDCDPEGCDCECPLCEETDGWRAQRDYIRNSHYNYVPLNRWVHPETGEVWM